MEAVFGVMVGLAVIGILFVIPVIVLVRVSSVLRELESLSLRFHSLESALKKIGAAQPSETVQKPLAQPVAAAVSLAAAPSPVVLHAPVPPVALAQRPSAPVAVPPEPTPAERMISRAWNWLVIGEEYRRPGVSWEYAVATNWLLRIGILVVLAGIAFFLKYSIEKGLLGPLGRVSLSLVVGSGLICFGVRLLFKKYHLLGQGLVGAGFVTLYFAFYAASGMYHLMSQGMAFALMACVTVAAGVLAVYYQSLMIAVLGLIGGYATPVMIGDSGAGAVPFYAYVLLLGCGVLGVSMVRRWPVLNVLGMLASYALAFLYCERHHAQAQLMHDLLFLAALHLLYLLSVILINIRKRLPTTGVEGRRSFSTRGSSGVGFSSFSSRFSARRRPA